MTDAERLAQAKAAILKDIEDGIIPTDVGSLADLTDWVYINYYGGIVEADTDTPDEFDFTLIGAADRLHDALDHWLRADRPDDTPSSQLALL